MTLSTFLRDYLYIPLGGNRKGPLRRYLNLLATMLLGGLWHGAGWTFVIWGGLHGLYLIINHGWRGLKARLGWGEGGRVATLGAGALTFLAVVVAWVFFRADSFTTAQSILAGMAGMNGVSLPRSLETKLASVVTQIPQVHLFFNKLTPASGIPEAAALLSILIGLALVWLFPNVRQIMRHYKPTWEDMAGRETPAPLSEGVAARWLTWRPSPAVGVFLSLLFLWCVDSLSKVSEFLYFQF